MATLYRAKMIRFESGERFPMLIELRRGLPDVVVIDYSLAYHRVISINSSMAQVATIGLFMEWAEERGINLDARFGTGDLFTQAEIEDLAGTLKQSKRKTLVVAGRTMPGNVIGDTHGNRLDWTRRHVEWRATSVCQSMPVSDPRVGPMNARMNAINRQLLTLKTKGGSKKRCGLTDYQQQRLFEMLRPGSSDNPFHAAVQYRNFLILLLYFELGLRKAEPLVIKYNHLHLHDREMPHIIIQPNPNDPDEVRRQPPLVKTAGRTLPLSPLLSRTMHEYVVHHRSKLRGAKMNPFVILETETGRAMSLAAVHDIFKLLRARLPDVFPADFSAHILRHTWNDRYRKAAKAKGMSDAEIQAVGNYLMGWSKTSMQAVNYTRRQIEAEAAEAMTNMHNAMLDVLS